MIEGESIFMIEFFRDSVTGFWYFLYMLACIFFMFALLGVVADRKRERIAVRLKAKRQEDIASGKVARLAAMETKENLDIMSTMGPETNDTTPAVSVIPSTAPVQNFNQQIESPTSLTNSNEQKEDVPSVLVIGATGESGAVGDTGVVTGNKNVNGN